MARSPLDPLAHRRSALAVCRQGARASVAVPPGARLSGSWSLTYQAIQVAGKKTPAKIASGVRRPLTRANGHRSTSGIRHRPPVIRLDEPKLSR